MGIIVLLVYKTMRNFVNLNPEKFMLYIHFLVKQQKKGR